MKCLVGRQLGTCHNTEGAYRCSCLAGAFSNTLAGKECSVCRCNPNGVTSAVCDGNSGDCLCNSNVGGSDCRHCVTGYKNYPYCNQCDIGYYGYPNCVRCSCTDMGVKTEYCNSQTGVCTCKDRVVGAQCDHCQVDYKNFPNCVEDVRDATLSAWGPWSEWKDQGVCGPSTVTGFKQTRKRRRLCVDVDRSKHRFGKDCEGKNFACILISSLALQVTRRGFDSYRLSILSIGVPKKKKVPKSNPLFK